jgi:hypothetical protein
LLGHFLAWQICVIWARYSGLANWFVLSVVVFWVAFSTVALTTEIVESAVTTVLSCFAEVSACHRTRLPLCHVWLTWCWCAGAASDR